MSTTPTVIGMGAGAGKKGHAAQSSTCKACGVVGESALRNALHGSTHIVARKSRVKAQNWDYFDSQPRRKFNKRVLGFLYTHINNLQYLLLILKNEILLHQGFAKHRLIGPCTATVFEPD